MRRLLDTSTLVDVLRGRPDVSARFRASRPAALATCAVVRAELLAGAWRVEDGDLRRARISRFLAPLTSWPFDDAAADRYGPTRALLERAGAMIGANDLLIASVALARDAVVVTSNVGEFARVPGLRVEDWRVEDRG